MKVTVEFTEIARMLTDTTKTEVEVENGASYHQVVKKLAQDYPALVGPLISSEDLVLLSSTVFVRNSKDMITYEQMDERPQDGDHLKLLTVIVGGSSAL